MYMTPGTVQALAGEMLKSEQESPAKLGKGWWKGFKRRHPELCTRAPRSLDVGRARNASEATLTQFYDLLQTTCEKHGVDTNSIWNVDEKGFNPDPAPRRVVASRRQRNLSQQHRKSQDHITANICVSAAGNHLPPQIIYNRKQLSTSLTSNGPPGTIYSTSANGSMDRTLFMDWFSKIFLCGTSRDKTQLLLMDNHSSHISVELIELARESNVILLALPAKTTHLLQPLDRTVFSSLGAHYQSASAAIRLVKPNHQLTLSDFMPAFTEAFYKSITPTIILASFRVTGVSPLNRAAIPASSLLPAAVHRTSATNDCWSEQQQTVFQRRFDGETDGESEDDDDYDAWKLWKTSTIEAAAEQSSSVFPLAQSLVLSGAISQTTVDLFHTPMMTPQRLPSAAAQARSLTSDEFVTAPSDNSSF
eukprot:scpid85942/ scgid35164/ Tigger transposable element-derived protein 1